MSEDACFHLSDKFPPSPLGPPGHDVKLVESPDNCKGGNTNRFSSFYFFSFTLIVTDFKLFLAKVFVNDFHFLIHLFFRRFVMVMLK